MYYMKPLKSPTHIHFLTKNFYGFETVFALWFWDFLHVLYAYYAERKFCHKYTHALSPVWNRPPIYAHYMREKFRPQIYMIIAVRLKSVGNWLSFGIFAFVYIMFCVCGHRLDKDVFVDWSMSKFDCKSVMWFHKFIVKMWLCICNCMCICVCMWRWLWFCYRLDSVVIRL